MKNNVTVWAAQNLVEMTKAQLLAVWSSQERISYVECMRPATKKGIILSILSWQESHLDVPSPWATDGKRVYAVA